MNNSIDINVKAGHLRRYIEAIRDGLTVMIKQMESVPTMYCETCGCILALCEKQMEGALMKWCPNCMDGKRYIFPKEGD